MNIPVRNNQFSSSSNSNVLALIEQTDSLTNEVILDVTSRYPEFMTVEQVAEALQVSHNTVRTLLKQHVIPGKKLSHKWIIPREALAKALINA